MESRAAIVKHQSYFLAFFAIFSTICCVQVICSSPLSIKLDRATHDQLLIDVQCDVDMLYRIPYTWQHKSSSEEDWKNYTDIMVHGVNSKAFYILGLRQQSTHFIRIVVERYGITSNELQATTCPRDTPTVNDLKASSTGPGWLDIRWKRPKEHCKSFFTYYVNYRAGNGPFDGFKKYGYIDTPDSRARIHPHHPCDTYPQEFCVLLTDRVQAGQRHTVQVYLERLGSSSHSDVTSINVVADYVNSKSSPELHGSHSAVQCEDDEEKTTKYQFNNTSHSTTEQQISIPIWVIIVAANVVVIILITITITWIVLSVCNKSTKVLNSPQSEDISSASQPVRYIRNFRTSERMNNQNPGTEIPEYEEINFGKSQMLNQNLHNNSCTNIYE